MVGSSNWMARMSGGVLVTVLVCSVLLDPVRGHGMMVQPASRSTLWRFNNHAPINYDDNALFCGGWSAQWEINGGRCGACGDDYRIPQPRPNENGGKFGRGIVVANYQPGGVVNVGVQITANHKGYFNFSICALPHPAAVETEACFKPLPLVDGSPSYVLASDRVGLYKTQLRLPVGFMCDRCVLRWHYNAGNNWGICSDGQGKLGCGPQETFRTCADVSVTNKRTRIFNKILPFIRTKPVLNNKL